MRAILFLTVWLELTAAASPKKKIFCHVSGRYLDMRDIDPTLCTHVVYLHACIRRGIVIKTVPSEITANNKVAVAWINEKYKRLNALRDKNPFLKTMITLRGSLTDFITCPKMGSNSTCPEKVTDNIVEFAKRYKFDGIDIYWTWNVDEISPQEKHDLIEQLKSLRTRFDRENLTLTASVYDSKRITSGNFKIPQMIEYLDFISLPSYEYKGYDDGYTRLKAPLQARYYDNALDKTESVEALIMCLLSQGTPKDKLVIAIGPTGPSFTLATPDDHTIGAPIRSFAAFGVHTNLTVYVGYINICKLQKSGDWSVVFDEEYRVPYTFKGDQWVSYENVQSFSEKAELVTRLNIAGITVMDIHGDDYSGICGEKWPLLKALNTVFRRSEPAQQKPPPAVAECAQLGYFHDPYSCGVILCAPNITGGYSEYHFECRPGNCYNSIIGNILAYDIDYNFFVYGD